ncbi:MAG: VTT domain-containing protein [Candidatus Obscuribacterales bacterium]|nr:VTT domain-containing protein [Steroidobacteraceae bacterium]
MPTQNSVDPLFQPERNCWRVAHADRVAFLIDADAYFKAFTAAARNAQRSILILGWDFHSRMQLPHERNAAGEPIDLGQFLNSLVNQRRELEMHILTWDFPMIFGLDRDWAPMHGLGWKPARRVHFQYDNTHPVGGSQHQKVVVIDDSIAFCGGIDLTCRRWDTCAHAIDEARRAVQGVAYPPFHDVMIAVEGDAARVLGDLVRERWRKATGNSLHPPDRPRRLQWLHNGWGKDRATNTKPWPNTLESHVGDVDVAVSRTEPDHGDDRGVREVEALYLDMIAAARHAIYIENQYFTSESIADALCKRLAAKTGPEIVIVLRELSHGWLEEVTMQTLRTRQIAKLQAADKHDRLHVFYPFTQGLKEGTCIDVHTKLIIVDDAYARIGSANVSNRSMGFDTECDVTVAATGRDDVRKAIRNLRSELLAEHLGSTAARVDKTVEQTGSMRGAIEQLANPDRTLKRLESPPSVPETVMTLAGVADPEKPIALKDLFSLFTPEFDREVATANRKPLWVMAIAVALLIGGLTAMWKFTPLAALLDPQDIAGWARDVGSRWWAAPLVVLAYTPVALTLFPRPLLTLFAVVAFGPWVGIVCAICGIELSAWLTYMAGRKLDRNKVRRIAGRKLNRMIDVLRHRGLLAMIALRLVPVAPFAVEGVVAGAVRIKLWHFMLGTAIGMLPGTLTTTVLGDQLEAALEDPSTVNYWMVGGAVLLFALAIWFVRRWFNKSAAQHPSPAFAKSS